MNIGVVAGVVGIVGGSILGAPDAAMAATHGHAVHPRAVQASYSVKVLNPDAADATSNGVDLANDGSALVNDNNNVYVVRRAQVRKLSQASPSVQWNQATGMAMNDSLRVAGYAFNNANALLDGAYVQWASPKAPYSVTCTNGGCATDYMSYRTTTKINAKGEELVGWSGHSGPWAAFLDASGVSHSLPGAAGKVRAQVKATGLSDASQVVGWAYGSAAPRASVTSNTGFAWLQGMNTSDETHADAISPSGKWIVGGQGDYSQAPATNNTILWNSARKPTVLRGVPAGFVASAVNDKGWFVGTVDNVAYVVRGGKAAPLSTLVSLPKGMPAGTTMCDARDINASGQILVNTCSADGSSGVALLLTPKK